MTGWGSINPAGDVWGPVLKQDYAELWTNEVLVTCHVTCDMFMTCHVMNIVHFMLMSS